mgnify:CR=1 FL=1
MSDDDRLGCGPFVFLLIALVPLGLLSAFVFATLWGWFLVPLGAPTIGVLHAYGIRTLAFSVQHFPKSDGEGGGWDKAIEAVLRTLFIAGMTLASGWVVLQFMGVAA